jgi:hypothetical protein
MRSQKSGYRLTRRNAGRLAGALGLLLALCLVVGGVMPAYAQPPQIPHGFHGTVSVGDPPVLVAEGTAVEAYVNDVKKAETTVDDQGKYSLLVSGTAGAEVTFRVGGVLANETAIWESGAVQELDLAIAAPPVVQYDLTVNSTAGGEVTDPGEGTFSYDAGTVVDLLAVPEVGYQFVNWTGDTGAIDDVDSADTFITMNSNCDITANFEEIPPVQYDLTVNSTAGGEVTDPGEGTFSYDAGAVVDLLAVPEVGYQFVNWTGDTGAIDDVDSADTFITMNGNYDITANFEEIPVPPPEGMLIGTNTPGNLNTGRNKFILSRFQALETGTVSEIRVYSLANGTAKVAIYADDAGEPGALITANNNPQAVVANQWNALAIGDTPIIQGSYYWLAVATNQRNTASRNANPMPIRCKSVSFASFNFPDPAGAGFNAGMRELSIAGWGGAVAPEPPAAPTRDCSALTFKWNASAGATKYHLQVNTSADFSGTNMFNGEVGNVTSYEVTGLTAGTTYYYRIMAGNAAGWSGWSSTGSMRCGGAP